MKLMLLKISFFILFCFLPIKIWANNFIISEILISSKDNPDYEFIELFNNSNQKINIKDYQIIKTSASLKEYSLVNRFPAWEIPAFEYVLIGSEKFPEKDLSYSVKNQILAPNNCILLRNNQNKTIDKLCFGQINNQNNLPINPKPGDSLERKKNENNNYLNTNNNFNDFFIQMKPNPEKNKNKKIITSSITPKTTQTVNKEIENISGIISCPPNTLYQKSFYLEPQGYEIYLSSNFKNNWQIGDEIKITGPYILKNKQLKINNEKQINLIKQNQPINSETIELTKINKDYLYKLITTEGQITNSKYNYLTISENKTDLTIYLKGITINPNWITSKKLKISGILELNTQNKLILLPRNQKDIEIIKTNEEISKNLSEKTDINTQKILKIKNLLLYISLGLNFIFSIYIISNNYSKK